MAQDEGFHEIQLNGKQLVFLFMAATVVSVVIFLCGVLVGRGVRVERPATVDTSTVASTAETTPPPTAIAAPVATPAGSDPTKAATPPAAEDLSYFNRLEKPNTQAEQLKPAQESRAAVPEKPASRPEKLERKIEKPAPAPAPAATPVADKSAARSTNDAAAEPSSGGFAVQIAALNVRSEAEAIAKRLSSKGYAAYVLSPAGGTPTVYRVRVGKFPTRREAETMASKLQREEQVKPWVTR